MYDGLYPLLTVLLVVEVLHDSIRHYSSLLDHKIRASHRVKLVGILIGLAILYITTEELGPVLYYAVLRLFVFDVLYWLCVKQKWMGFKFYLENHEIVKQIKDLWP